MTHSEGQAGRLEALATLRQALAGLRQEAGAMQKRLQELATVKDAEEDYALALADAQAELVDAERRLREKVKEKTKLERLIRPQQPSGPPVLRRGRRPWSGGTRPPMHGLSRSRSTTTETSAASSRPASDAGQRFKELANRWYAYWGLQRTLLSQINRITDDPTSAPGEALMMLEDSYFEKPILPDETVEEQLERLGDWHDMLTQYRDQLTGEIDTQVIRSQNVLGIWEKWQTRDQDDTWASYIAQSIQDRRDKVAETEAQIVDLEVEITELRSQV